MRLMKTVSSVGSVDETSVTVKPWRSAALNDRGHDASRPPDDQEELRVDAVDVARRRRPRRGAGRRVRRGRRRAVTVTMVSAPVVLLELDRRTQREQLAVVDDREPVTQLIGLFHVVRREEDGLAVGVQLAEDLPEGDATLRVEAGGRLVEEEDRGPVHDRPGHHEPLSHAAGERRAPATSPGRRGGTARPAWWPRASRLRPSCRRSGRGSRGSPTPTGTGRACWSGARPRSPAWRSAGCATTSIPPTSARPLVGITPVVSMPAVVVFPAPFGPSRPKISPRRTERSSSSTARMSPG